MDIRVIANTLIYRSFENGRLLTLKELNRMLYIVDAEYRKKYKAKLIDGEYIFNFGSNPIYITVRRYYISKGLDDNIDEFMKDKGVEILDIKRKNPIVDLINTLCE